MEYRTDGLSGNELSILGLGCMRFAQRPPGQIDMEKAERLVRAAIDGGVNYLDTAYVYGDSEQAVGSILAKDGLRDRVFLATKLPHYQCKSVEDFERIFRTQLERLKTDHIDYYLIHNLSDISQWDRVRCIFIEDWIAKKKESGEIGRIGFSYHGKRDGFAELLDSWQWDFCQIQYNYMNENYQAGRSGLEMAHERGLPVIVMEPLLGGKLATNLPKKALAAIEGRNPRLSPAAWAFRWLWDQPGVTVCLSGMNSLEQLEDNLAAADKASPGCLSDEERKLYPAIVAAISESYPVPCTGCNYCMPCPTGVSIPECFAALNIRASMGIVAGMQSYMTSTGIRPGSSSRASACVRCGRCEKLCPQHIPIMDSLVKVRKKMEPLWFKPIMRIISRVMS
jgi:predicted aldo/keto reductase-like oxidoreductase